MALGGIRGCRSCRPSEGVRFYSKCNQKALKCCQLGREVPDVCFKKMALVLCGE